MFEDCGNLPLCDSSLILNEEDDKIPYISNEIGLGASLLLITLKAFATLFFILSIVNIPTMVLFAFGNKGQLKSLDAQ